MKMVNAAILRTGVQSNTMVRDACVVEENCLHPCTMEHLLKEEEKGKLMMMVNKLEIVAQMTPLLS
jgi:hypothetical protein